jgi:hypothetical protein
VTASRLLLAALLLCVVPITVRDAHALDIAPGTTSPTLQAEGCATASGAILGPCVSGCIASCVLPEHTAEAYLDITNYTLGKKFVEATVYSDFTVTASPGGAATSLDATVSYDVAWAGGWTITGVFTGWNDAKSEITLTLTDLTAGGTVVRSSPLHTMSVDGFIGIEIIDVGFGLDRGATVNTMDVRVIRGHSYRLGLKVRCEGKGVTNAFVLLDYQTGGWGVNWNELKITVAADLAEEIEKLKRRVDALEDHTHTYLTGRGEGHNNTEAETSKPILVVEEPSDDERRLLPPEGPNAEPLPVKSVFLANAPNPFNPTTTITYTLPEPLRVSINLYTAQGKLARTLVDDGRAAGPHAVAFDGSGLASGVYYYRLTAGRFTETRKLTLLK